MNKNINFIIAIFVFFLSCTEYQYEGLNSRYENDQNVFLELSDNGIFHLGIPDGSTKFIGSYRYTETKLSLLVERREYLPFVVNNSEIKNFDGYQITVIRSDSRKMENVRCKIELNNTLIDEKLTNTDGKVTFEGIRAGRLFISYSFLQEVELELSELKSNNVTIKLETERFYESLPRLEFSRNGEFLVSENYFDSFQLEKKTR